MIEVNVKGLEQLIKVVNWLDPEILKRSMLEIIIDELTTFMYKIEHDENIPEEYRKSLVLFTMEQEGKVMMMAYAPGKTKWKRKGRYMVWKRYRCPIRKYFGGELTPAYSGPEYLKMKWEEQKDQIVKKITSRIVSEIKRGL